MTKGKTRHELLAQSKEAREAYESLATAITMRAARRAGNRAVRDGTATRESVRRDLADLEAALHGKPVPDDGTSDDDPSEPF